MSRVRHWLCGGCFLLGVLLLSPEPTSGQPGGFGGGRGGFGGKGGGRFNFNDPETVFNFYAKGADVIDVSKMDPNQRAFLRSSFEKRGIPVPPDNAVISKPQFVSAFNQALAAKGMAPAPGGAPSGQPAVIAIGPGGTTTTPGGGFGGRGFGPPGGFSGGGPPGFSRGGDSNRGGDSGSRDPGFRMTDQDIERKFADSDANKDGKLAPDEISDRSPLKELFKESDTDKDGSISLAEYKAYIAARFGGGEGGVYGGSGSGGDRRDPRDQKKEPEVFAIRYGKLPDGLPAWWKDLDADKDGQVGLYEWRQDGRDVAEFMKMDLDGDGFLAPLEWQRYNVKASLEAKAIAAEEGIEGTRGGGGGSSGGRGPGMYNGGGGGGSGGRGMFPGGGRGSSEKGGSDKSARPEKGDKGGPNPFREGGKKKGN